jgi:hypothetical protein
MSYNRAMQLTRELLFDKKQTVKGINYLIDKYYTDLDFFLYDPETN